MSHTDKRDIMFYVLECRTKNQKASNNLFNIDNIAEPLWIKSKNGCKKEYENHTRTISIKHICDDEDNFLSILLSSSDTRKPDPSFEDIVTGEHRIAQKKRTEGLSESVHIVIDMNAYSYNKHICTIEHVYGFTRTDIIHYLDVLSREICKQVQFIDSEGKVCLSGPELKLYILNDSISTDINKGGCIFGLTLLSDTPNGDGLDNPTWMDTKSEEVEIRVKKGTTLDQIREWFNTDDVKNKFTRFKINYKTSKGQKRSAIAHHKEDSLDFAFGRIEPIALSNPIISTSLDSIHSELNNKMKDLLRKERINNASPDNL